MKSSRIDGVRLFLAGMVLAVFGALLLTSYAAAHPAHGGMPGAGAPMGRMLERMLDGADATDAQRAQIRQITDAAAADMKVQHEAARALRERGLELFAQPTVDAGAVEALRQQMLQQHDRASQRMTKMMLDIGTILTPEQRTRIAERMKQRHEMMQRHHRERRQLDTPTR